MHDLSDLFRSACEYYFHLQRCLFTADDVPHMRPDFLPGNKLRSRRAACGAGIPASIFLCRCSRRCFVFCRWIKPGGVCAPGDFKIAERRDRRLDNIKRVKGFLHQQSAHKCPDIGNHKGNHADHQKNIRKQITGVEPASPAWEASVLPMNYICRKIKKLLTGLEPVTC